MEHYRACHDTMAIVQSLCTQLDWPQEVVENFRQGNPPPPVDLDFINSDVDDFGDRYALSEVLSKYECFHTLKKPRDVALEAFTVQEGINRQTNLRLRSAPLNDRISRIIQVARHEVRKVVGRSIRPHLEWIVHSSYFGPGSNVGTYKNRTTETDKMSEHPTCTNELLNYATSLINTSAVYPSLQMGGTDGHVSLLRSMCSICDSKLTTVPKNAKTDRVITVEPLLNSFLQGGIARWLRVRLKRVNIDLEDQSINQQLARHAHARGLVTVDLAQASNSLTISCVYLLTSHVEGLYELLNLARSSRYTLNGESVPFQMFSGMGNTATFPLEVLCFYALAKATAYVDNLDPFVSIYGDDIICADELYPKLKEIYSYFGFEVNSKKTHSFPDKFRESCGEHYYNGVCVTPFYIRRPITSVKEAIVLHNGIWNWAARSGYHFDARVLPTLKLIRRMYPFGFVNPSMGSVGYFPLTSWGNEDTLYRCKILVAKSKPRRIPRKFGLYVLCKALNAIQGSDDISLGPDRNSPKGCITDPASDPWRLDRRIRDPEYVSRRSTCFGYKFPYIIA